MAQYLVHGSDGSVSGHLGYVGWLHDYMTGPVGTVGGSDGSVGGPDGTVRESDGTVGGSDGSVGGPVGSVRGLDGSGAIGAVDGRDVGESDDCLSDLVGSGCGRPSSLFHKFCGI
jgi:hypothetical protein